MAIINFEDEFSDLMEMIEVIERKEEINNIGESVVKLQTIGIFKMMPPQPSATKLIESLEGELIDSSYRVFIPYNQGFKPTKGIYLKFDSEVWRVNEVLNWNVYAKYYECVVKMELDNEII